MGGGALAVVKRGTAPLGPPVATAMGLEVTKQA